MHKSRLVMCEVRELSVEYYPSVTRTHLTTQSSGRIPDAVHNGDTHIKVNVHTFVQSSVSLIHLLYSRAKFAVIGLSKKRRTKAIRYKRRPWFPCLMILLVMLSDYHSRNPSVNWARAQQEILQLLTTG
jgi:hypothetical protein